MIRAAHPSPISGEGQAGSAGQGEGTGAIWLQPADLNAAHREAIDTPWSDRAAVHLRAEDLEPEHVPPLLANHGALVLFFVLALILGAILI